MSLIQNTFLTDEQHQQVARYLAECTDEQAQRLPELLRYMEYDLSLSYQLGRLSKPELDRIRQATSLKRASRLNKADLVTALEQWLPSQLMQSLSLLDGRGFALLKSLLAQQYVKPYEFEYKKCCGANR